jgi:hypothetical protein
VKYFICALEGIHLGIPAEQTERIIPVSRAQTAVYETENQETISAERQDSFSTLNGPGGFTGFISLPVLFQLKDLTTPHGLILKKQKSITTIILAPKIDIELEIPEENIHSLPKALAGQFKYFRGVCFNKQNVLLLLDTQKLIESLQ